MFQLIEPTTIRLKHINLRDEKHGKHKVSAADFDYALEGDNQILDLLHPKLRAMLYFDPDTVSGQGTVDGVTKTLRKPVMPQLGVKFSWALERTAMDMVVIYGVGDERSNIAFDGGKLVIKGFEAKDNGVAAIFFRFSTSAIPDGALDKMRLLTDQAVTATLIQNERLLEQQMQRGDDPDEDDEEEGNAPDATDLFLAGTTT